MADVMVVDNWTCGVYMAFPVAGLSPNTKRRTPAIVDMRMNGIETTNHETIPKPARHMMLSKYVKSIAIQTCTKAELYRPLYTSKMMRVVA